MTAIFLCGRSDRKEKIGCDYNTANDCNGKLECKRSKFVMPQSYRGRRTANKFVRCYNTTFFNF